MSRLREHAREVELKLALSDSAVRAFAQHSAFQASPAAALPPKRHEVTTYFDTADHALAQRRISLRVRRSNGGFVQTLKADRVDGVAADRGEWEWPVKHNSPDLSVSLPIPFADALTPDLDLKPVVTTEIDRTVYRVELDGGTVVEAALDQGFIIAGGARQPVRELELELRKGSPAPLYRLALELHAAAPLTVAVESKAERGYRLLDNSPPSARKAHDVVLKDKLAGAEAFCKILSAGLGHLLANQPAARSSDIEGIHQMRVAIRRLRAALVLFEPHLEQHVAARFQDELRRVGQAFGEARDWDVFCTELLPESFKHGDRDTWRELLDAPAAARREAAHGRFVAEVDGSAFTALVLGMAAWAEAGRSDRSLLGSSALDRPVGDLASEMLDHVVKKVERRGRHLNRRTDAQRHALRKALKKLRYSIDYLGTLYSPKDVKSYLHACKGLQEDLGAINDAVTGVALANSLADAARPDLAPAIGALARHLGHRQNKALAELGETWKAFQAKPRFWA